MNEIIPDLWISDIYYVREESLDVDHVVTCCQEDVSDNVGCQYSFYCMSDGPDNEFGGDHRYELWVEAVEDVLESYVAGNEILVHCHAGRSRSASVCVAVVGMLRRYSYGEARSFVCESRYIQMDRHLADHARRFLEERLGET